MVIFCDLPILKKNKPNLNLFFFFFYKLHLNQGGGLYTRAMHSAMFTILYVHLVHTCPTSGHLFCVLMCKFKIRDWDIITVHISLSVQIEESGK